MVRGPCCRMVAALACLFLPGVPADAQEDGPEPHLVLLADQTPPGPDRASSLLLEDLDGDGSVEMIWVEMGALRVADRSGRLRWAANLEAPGGIALVADVDADGVREVGVSSRKDLDLGITFYGDDESPAEPGAPQGAPVDGSRRRTVRAQGGTSYGQPDSGMAAHLVRDVTGDGAPDLLCHVSTGYGWVPRAVICFDLETGREQWRHDTGPGVTTIDAADLDGDGATEVFAGSYGPGNGNSAPDGTDDMHSYVWCFDGRTGRVRWCRETGTYFTGVSVRAIEGPGGPAVLATTSAAHDFRDDVGRAILFDGDGREAASYDVGVSIRSVRLLDTDADGSAEVLLTDRLGGLHLLSTALHPLVRSSAGTTQYDSLEFTVGAVADVTGDGRPEILAVASEREPIVTNPRSDTGPRPVTRYHNVRVVILAPDLETVLAEIPIAEAWDEWPGIALHAADWDGDGRPEVVVLTDRIRAYGVAP